MAPLALRDPIEPPGHPDSHLSLLREAAMPWRSLTHNSRFIVCLWAEFTAVFVWAVGQIRQSDITSFVATIAAAMATLAGGYVMAAQVLDGRADKKRRADLAWQIEQQRILDEERRRKQALDDEERRKREAADRDSLSAALNESIRNQEAVKEDLGKLRATNHKINNDLNVIKLENHELHEDIRETTRQLHETSEKLLATETKLHEAMQHLYAANVRIGELTNELARVQRQTPGIVEDAAERGAAKGAGQVVERAAVKVAEKAAEVAEKAAEQAADVEAAAERGAEKGTLKALSDSNVEFPTMDFREHKAPPPDSGLGGAGGTETPP